MSKRDIKKYSNVVCGDIYNHYSIFSWKECWFCNKEFRREAGYRFQVQVNRPWKYSCSECSSSKENCNENVKSHMLKMREHRVVPPPVRP